MEALPTVTHILNVLRKRPADIQLKQIAKVTGLKHGWLSMFHQGRITNPSYENLKALYEYLVKLEIKV